MKYMCELCHKVFDSAEECHLHEEKEFASTPSGYKLIELKTDIDSGEVELNVNDLSLNQVLGGALLGIKDKPKGDIDKLAMMPRDTAEDIYLAKVTVLNRAIDLSLASVAEYKQHIKTVRRAIAVYKQLLDAAVNDLQGHNMESITLKRKEQ